MHVIPGFATYDRDVSPAINNGVDIIRIGTHCTESTVSYSLINNLRTQPVEVISCLMMSHMASTDILLNECLKLEEKGVDAISIYDSAGCFDPDQITELFTALRAKLTIKLGFHGHNNLGLAVANSYQAYRCGVNILDASICAFGAGAGNTQLETLATYFKKKIFPQKLILKIYMNLSNLQAQHMQRISHLQTLYQSAVLKMVYSQASRSIYSKPLQFTMYATIR